MQKCWKLVLKNICIIRISIFCNFSSQWSRSVMKKWEEKCMAREEKFVWEKKKKWCWYFLDDGKNFLFCMCTCAGSMLLIIKIVQGIFWLFMFHHNFYVFPKFSSILWKNDEKRQKNVKSGSTRRGPCTSVGVGSNSPIPQI